MAYRYNCGLAVLALAVAGVLLLVRRSGHPGFVTLALTFLLAAGLWVAFAFIGIEPRLVRVANALALVCAAIGMICAVAVVLAT